MLLLHEGHATALEFFTPENAASYDSVARYATFGQDVAWKRRIVQLVESCRSVLELACGTGKLTSMLSRPDRSITGIDLTFEYLVASKKRGDFRVAQGTAELLPYRELQFNAVVSSYLAKYVDIESVAQECLRILRPGGLVVFHDFTYPSNPGMQVLWKAYFRILQFAGLFAPTWRVVFDNLANYVRESKWDDIAASALENAGFRNITIEYYTAGTAATISAEKP
jgi:demethylmenaquinone methyltransferase / 2-methoxy-6-polyprenyl-1,4-benzoquinol methylase